MSAAERGLGLIPIVRFKKKEKIDSELPRESKATIEGSSGCDNDNSTDNRGHCATRNDDPFESNDSLIRITTSSASPVVIIGRSQLLNSFRVAIAVAPDQHKSDQDEKRESSDHREALQWGAKALSREMLRFSAAGMQINAKHSAGPNGVVISSNRHPQAEQDCGDANENSIQEEIVSEGVWRTKAVKIKAGNTLSFGPCVGRGLLEFRVVSLNQRSRLENDATVSRNDCTAKSKTKQSITGKSTNPCVIDLTAESEEGENQERIGINESLWMKTILDDDSKAQDLNKTNNPNKKNSVKPEKLPFLVHFFPFGNGFSASRRQKLEKNMKILGATILDDIWKAKYIVVSESIRSLAIVAKRMRVKEELLIRHFENNTDIRCIVPSWADHCISSAKCRVPSRIYAWCHSPASPNVATKEISRKRNRDQSDNHSKLQAIAQDSGSRKRLIDSVGDTIQTRRKCFSRNIQVAEAFKNLANLHQSMSLIPSDAWKSYSFRIVAGRLLELDFEISNDEETQQRLRSIKGFGKSVCEKIQEYIEHGTISRIEEFQSDPQRQAMKNLKDIWGVGIVRASDLMDRGYRTIDDVRQGLRQGKLFLQRNQLVGVDCYEDILDKMSRSEVEAIGETVRLVAERLFPGIKTSIMGSYRRGKKSCGDVDIQITHPDFVRNIPTDALGRIIDTLWSEGNIAMHLTFLIGMTTGSHYKDYQKASRHVPKDAWEGTKSPSKMTEYKFYMGCFNSPIHPHRRRRVDIKFYPYRERAFATLYFTGNGYFNRSMRLWATRVFGFKLSDQGLFARGCANVRVFEASTEREIFDRLQLVYREPHERQYWDALEPIDKDIEPDLRLTESQLKHDKNSNQWVK